jgi:hypothetical protein
VLTNGLGCWISIPIIIDKIIILKWRSSQELCAEHQSMFCPTCVGFLHCLSLSLVCGTKSLLWYSCRHREWNRMPMEKNGKKKSEDIEWHSIDFGQRSSINKISYWDSILHYHDLKCLKEAVIVPTHLLTLLKSKCRVHCTYGPVFGEDSCCRENHLPTAAPPPARPEASKVSAWGRPCNLIYL